MRRFRPVISRNIRSVCRTYGGYSSGTAEQLTHDVFVKFIDNDYSRLKNVRWYEDKKFFGYVAITAKRVALDYFKRPQFPIEVIEEADWPDERQLNQHDRLLVEEIRACLKRILKGKNAQRDRLIFELRCREFTVREIASIRSIGLTPDGVESVITRLLKEIRDELIGKCQRSNAAKAQDAV